MGWDGTAYPYFRDLGRGDGWEGDVFGWKDGRLRMGRDLELGIGDLSGGGNWGLKGRNGGTLLGFGVGVLKGREDIILMRAKWQ